MQIGQIVETIVEQARAEVQHEMESIAQAAAGDGLAQIEQRLQVVVAGFQRWLLEGVSAALGRGYSGSQIKCACGGWMKFVGDREKTILTMLGELRMSRAYYWCPACHAGRFPLDERLGIAGQGQSFGVKITTALVCALLPNGEAMELLGKLNVPHVSVKESQRVTRELGQQALAERDEQAQSWREQHIEPRHDVRRSVPERLAVLMDGTTAHTDGDWHEAKVGSFYTFDEEGQFAGDKSCVSTFAGIEHFRSLWDTEAQRWQLGKAKHIVALCDGAAWTWNTIAECCPEHTVQILDFYHASEHLWGLAHTLWGEGTAQASRWVKRQQQRLLQGDLTAFFKELKGCTSPGASADEARSQLQYFENNRQRLGYAEAIARGDPIGSGMVEAACKTIICLREKQPGMRWRKHTAEVIAHLRCIYYSGRWDSFRGRLMNRRVRAA
jgi:hypothetical protein